MDKRGLIEAALFASSTPISIQTLCKIADSNEEEVRKIIEEIRSEFENMKRGIEIAETPEGFELRIKPEYRERVKDLAPFADLGVGCLRTLSIIILKQPITQAEIVKIQGNKVYEYIRELEKKGLIKTKKSKRTKLVFTTENLEKYFGLKLEDIRERLKKVEEEF